MITLLLVLALALLCAPASVLPLASGRWQVWRPRLALALWLGIGLLGLVLAVLSVLAAAVLVTTIHPARGGVGSALALVILAWTGLGGLGVLASLGLVTGASRIGDTDADAEDGALTEGLSSRAQGAPRPVAPVTRRVIEDATVGAVLYEIEDPTVIACAVGDGQGEILVSSRARAALSVSELQAVLAHEVAHLRSHHAAVRRLGAWHAACLPRGSSLRRLLVTRVHLLTELAADDAAARQVGRERLCAGLRAAHTLIPSPELLVRAERLATIEEDAPAPLPIARVPARR